ncbi:MAG: peptide ABC transporter substrate-binding protein [Rhodobacteraceae bacterium]|nr:MAG: peptide ABC transporter substrate-binding protein [Paracoccaceae bacterium]
MSRLVDRRALFTSGAAAALLAASGVSLQAAPREGGRLRLAVPRGEMFDAVLRGTVLDTLTEVGADGILRGELATEWTADSSASAWRFSLRDDVRFHDGSAFDASEAARLMQAMGFDALAEGADLRIRLSAPDPDLPYRLSDPALALFRDADDMPLGTGPYALRTLRPGRHMIADRVRPHYRDGQSGWFDSVEVAVIPDAHVRAEALRDGFVDVAALPSVAGLAGASGLRFHPDAQTAQLALREGVVLPRRVGNRAPLDDGRLTRRWWMA